MVKVVHRDSLLKGLSCRPADAFSYLCCKSVYTINDPIPSTPIRMGKSIPSIFRPLQVLVTVLLRINICAPEPIDVISDRWEIYQTVKKVVKKRMFKKINEKWIITHPVQGRGPQHRQPCHRCPSS